MHLKLPIVSDVGVVGVAGVVGMSENTAVNSGESCHQIVTRLSPGTQGQR